MLSQGLRLFFKKATKGLCGGGSEFKFSPTYVRTLVKRIKPFRIVYFKSGLQGLRLSKGEHQNNGGSKVAKEW